MSVFRVWHDAGFAQIPSLTSVIDNLPTTLPPDLSYRPQAERSCWTTAYVRGQRNHIEERAKAMTGITGWWDRIVEIVGDLFFHRIGDFIIDTVNGKIAKEGNINKAVADAVTNSRAWILEMCDEYGLTNLRRAITEVTFEVIPTGSTIAVVVRRTKQRIVEGVINFVVDAYRKAEAAALASIREKIEKFDEKEDELDDKIETVLTAMAKRGAPADLGTRKRQLDRKVSSIRGQKDELVQKLRDAEAKGSIAIEFLKRLDKHIGADVEDVENGRPCAHRFDGEIRALDPAGLLTETGRALVAWIEKNIDKAARDRILASIITGLTAASGQFRDTAQSIADAGARRREAKASRSPLWRVVEMFLPWT